MSRDELYLRHILDAIEKIGAYAQVGEAVFFAESHWQDAVIRQLEILGEAVKQLSPAVRESHPEVPWRLVAGMRDMLIHNYMGVDLKAVWQTVVGDLPVLDGAVRQLLAGETGGR